MAERALADRVEMLEQVARFISPPPTSVAGFETFIRWAHRERAAGRYACFAVVPERQSAPVGMFQVRLLDADRRIAEWGFALGSAYWGHRPLPRGRDAPRALRVRRDGLRQLDARAALLNARGNGALRKVGAVMTAVLRQAFERHGERLDQALWTIHRDDWDTGVPVWRGSVQ